MKRTGLRKMYEDGEIMFKGLLISWKKIDEVQKWGKNFNEEFRFWIKVIGKPLEPRPEKISLEFYNSNMEWEISQKIARSDVKAIGSNWKQFKDLVYPKMWGGYDDCKNFNDFWKERVYWLLSGAIVSLFENKDFRERYNFKEFCSEFGYDIDSMNAHNIYRACIAQQEALSTLKIPESFWKYYEKHINQETNTYNKDVRAAIEELAEEVKT